MFDRNSIIGLKSKNVSTPRTLAVCLVLPILVLTALLGQMQRVYAQSGSPVQSKELPTQSAGGVAIASPYDADYSFIDLGSPTGIPTPLGGVLFSATDPDILLIGGAANGASGELYAIPVVRDGNDQITGFAGPAVKVGDTPYIDGGLVRAPNGTLFSSGWPINFLYQTLPGNTMPDAAIDLNNHGITPSPGAFQFVSAGFPGAGQFKLASYDSGEWYEVDLQVQPSGLYSITNTTLRTTIVNGPEGIVYVPAGSPQFTDYTSILVSEYSIGEVSVFDIDANGDPISATRRLFMTGVAGAEGATIDPVSGNFVFSTFGADNTVIVVSGFSPLPTSVSLQDFSGSQSTDLLFIVAAAVFGLLLFAIYRWRLSARSRVV